MFGVTIPSNFMEIEEFDSIEECLALTRRMLTPKNDKYGAPEVGVALANTGWFAFARGGSFGDGGLLVECKPSAMDAALGLFKKVRAIVNYHENEEKSNENNPV